MRVVTWNLWGRFGPWEQRAPGIEATLRRIDADIVCLQEVWAADGTNQADGLGAALGYEVVTSADTTEGRPIGNAVLSRWPVAGSQILALPRGDGAPGHRTLVHAEITAPHGPVQVHCTHLAYRFVESALRQRQLTRVCGFVAEHRNDETGFPPLLCGDLNAVPTSDEVRALTGQALPLHPELVFTDAWAAAGRGPGHTWDDRNPHLAGITWPRRRLDYVLVGWPRPRGLGNPIRARLAGGRTHGGVLPSDHLAVVVDLRTEAHQDRR